MDSDASVELLNSKLESLKKPSYILAIVVVCITAILGIVFLFTMPDVEDLTRRGECLMAVRKAKITDNFHFPTVICLLLSIIAALVAADQQSSNSRHRVENRYFYACVAMLISTVNLILGCIMFMVFLIYRRQCHVALRDCP